jgi:hypothetical protein
MATNAVGRRQYNDRSGRIVDQIMSTILLLDGDLNAAGFLATLNRLKARTVGQEKFEWDVDDYLPLNDTTAGTATSTALTVSVTTPLAYAAGQVWMNKTSGEVFRVESVDTANSLLTMKRGITALNSEGGTAAASMASGDTLIRLTPVVGEDNRRQTTQTTIPANVYNYTQAMRWELEMSRRQIKRGFKSGEAELPYQTKKTMLEARKQINGMILAGERGRYTDASEGDITLSGGIRPAITTYTFAVGGTLYQNAFNEWLVEEGLRKGNRNKVLISSTDVILAITEMTNDLAHFTLPISGGTNVGIQVMNYLSPNGGQLMIVEDRWLSENLNGEAYLLDMTQVERVVFSGHGINDDLHIEYDTEDPDDVGSALTLYGDMGLQWGAEAAHGKITGVSGGAKGSSVS